MAKRSNFTTLFIEKLSELRLGVRKKQLESIGMEAAENPKDFLKNIERYAVEGDSTYYELLERALQSLQRQGKSSLAKEIALLDIKNEKILVGILKVCVMKLRCSISSYIKDYHINNQKNLIELATISPIYTREWISMYIQDYGILDPKGLVHIAKMTASRNPREISEYIQNYGIQDQAALIEIAKMAAAQDGRGLSEHIKNYGIQDKAALLEIACIAATQNGHGLSAFVQNYEFLDSESLIKLAKLAAACNGMGVSEYIQNYGISDQAALMDIALIAAEKNGWGISKFIHHYGIQSEKVRIEIAKIAANIDPFIESSIQNYGIQSQEVLIELATFSVKRNPRIFSEYVQNYGIQSQEALVRLAKISASQNGRILSEYIQNYKIQSQEALLEIALVAAAQSGGGVSRYIQNYKIQSQESLVKIARVALMQSSSGASFYMHHYRIQKESDRLFLAWIGAIYGEDDIAMRLEDYNITRQKSIEELVRGFDFFVEIKSHLGGEKVHWDAYFSFKDLLENNQFLEGIHPVLEMNDPKERLIASLVLLGRAGLSCRSLSSEELSRVIKEVANYRNASLAVRLLGFLCLGGRQERFPSIYRELICKQGKVITDRILPSILPAYWMSSLQESSQKQKAVSHFLNQRFVLLTLKDHMKPLMQTLLHCSVSLEQSSLPLEKKVDLFVLGLDLSFLSSPDPKKRQECLLSELMKRYSLIRLFCRYNVDFLRRDFSSQNISGELSDQLQTLLQKQQIDLSGIDHFMDRYMNTFGQTRVPYALESYLGSMSHCKEKEVLNTLNRLVKSVLLGQFPQERQRESVHLQYLQKHFPGAIEAFEQEIRAIPLSQEEIKEDPMFYETFFQNKLQDAHWIKQGVDQFPELSRFIKTDPDARKEIYQQLQRQEEKKPEELLQEECMNLLSLIDPKEQKKALRKIFGILRSSFSDLELFYDIEGLMNRFQMFAQEYVVKSIDWQDLFLSGTEVSGSCQRVDGNVSMNKCLLAYCLDRKNALIAVKDSKGKILARAILRLLLDEDKQHPVLFIDRIYPDNCPPQRKKAIWQMASLCAEEMRAFGCALLTQDTQATILYPKSIQSLGSNCPYEYADGASGVMKQGIFCIKDVRLIEKERRSNS